MLPSINSRDILQRYRLVTEVFRFIDPGGMPKMNKTISVVSIILSVAAFGLSLSSFIIQRPAFLARADVDTLIREELAKKDHEQVLMLIPKAKRFYQDMLGPNFEARSFNPQTIQELLAPLLAMIPDVTDDLEISEKADINPAPN